MRLGELLNRKVVTRSGLSIGRVHDVTAELADGRLRVTGLVVGRPGFMARLGIRERRRPQIPWTRVARVDIEIVLRD